MSRSHYRDYRGIGILAFALMLIAGFSASAHAQSLNPFETGAVFHEAETKYMFGFLDGSDIGNENEKAIELETTGAFVKRTGRYGMLEQELEFEHVPTQNFAYELSAHGMFHSIRGVEDLDDLKQGAFSGLSAKLRYLVIGRGPGSPIGLTVSAEPEWARIDDADGKKTQAYSAKLRVVADTELIPNRLYAAVNATYEPGIDKGSDDTAFQRASDLGFGFGLAYRITPTFTFGGALKYDASYDGLAFNTLQGNAVFLGPTMQINFTPKILLAAAFSAQVWGRATDDPRAFDLSNFSKYQANLKLEFEF